MKEIKLTEIRNGDKIISTHPHFRYRVIFEVDHVSPRHLYLKPIWLRDEGDTWLEGDGNMFMIIKEEWLTAQRRQARDDTFYLLNEADVLITIMEGGKHPQDDNNFMETWEGGSNDDI
jgi:hypothetical protein